jgi:hypothetical protein
MSFCSVSFCQMSLCTSLNVVRISVVMLNAAMLGVIILNVLAPFSRLVCLLFYRFFEVKPLSDKLSSGTNL